MHTPKKPKKRPGDINQLAKMLVGESVSEAESAPLAQRTTKDPAAVALGRKGGLKGGPARNEALSKERRSAIAKKAAAARWSKKKD